MHSGLAGFVEAGETMEQAVARELWEETGIRIDRDSVRYMASQPWPFPQSTMLGFSATADARQVIDVDKDELVSAGWFDKDTVRQAAAIPGATMQHAVVEAVDPSVPLLIPPKGVIARRLVDAWLDDSLL